MTELTIDGGEVNSNPHFSLHKLLLTGSPCVALVQWAIPHALLQLIILFTVIIEDIQELSQVYRRCILGVRPKAFQIEDITECKSSSNDE
jgi:hypothetical protein